MTNLDRIAWTRKLADLEHRLGFSDGYHFVYGPWSSLDRGEIAFLSLNPGRTSDHADLRTISDERGNSYEVERATTKSPLTDQFLKLATFLGTEPSRILTGAAAPFRSKDWHSLTTRQRSESLALGREFWSGPLSRPELRLVIACSQPVADMVVDVTDALLVAEVSACWADVKLRRYRSRTGKMIVHLPHLSRYKLLSREASRVALRRIFDGVSLTSTAA